MTDQAVDKVYTPIVLAENPFPQQPVTGVAVTQPTTGTAGNQNTTNQTTPINPTPMQKVAVELLAPALNTATRKIIAEFQFTPSGAIQVGNYQQGVTGDIRISPTGIVARDKTGQTTFALDGETGNAFFLGEIRAGSIITGGTIVNANGTVIIDENGLVSQNSFQNGSVSASSGQTTTSTSYADLDSMTLTTPKLSRTTNVLILFTVQAAVNTSDGSAGDWYLQYILNVDGSDLVENFIAQGGSKSSGGDQNGVGYETPTLHALKQLASGSHTIKIRWKVVNNSGTGLGTTVRRTLSYLILGS